MQRNRDAVRKKETRVADSKKLLKEKSAVKLLKEKSLSFFATNKILYIIIKLADLAKHNYVGCKI